MSDCCSVANIHTLSSPGADHLPDGGSGAEGLRTSMADQTANSADGSCPTCGEAGRLIDRLTVKSMLTPPALASLDVAQTFRFCAKPACDTVYYGDGAQVFRTSQVRVPVYQKDAGEQVNACYCFGWTRARIRAEMDTEGTSTAATSIAAHIKAGRCACEVNNPQGACCLGNVNQTVKAIREEQLVISAGDAKGGNRS